MNWQDLVTTLLDGTRSATGLAVNWLIQSTLLVACGLAVGHWLRGRGSAGQSAIYRTTLVTVLVCPLATTALSLLGASGWSLQMPQAYSVGESAARVVPEATRASSTVVETAIESETAVDRSEAELAMQATPDVQPLAPFPDGRAIRDLSSEMADVPPAPPAVATNEAEPTLGINIFGIAAAATVAVWFVASAWFCGRLFVSWRQLSRLRRAGRLADPPTIATCHQIADQFNVTPPAVLHSPYLPSPCLTGVRRPAIMLPAAELSMPVRDVLIHELAHLRRNDCFWNLLRRTATAILFFQPLVWKLSRRMETAAEEVCDDYVVQFGGNRQEYAHRLVDIAELSLPPLAAAGVGIVAFRSMLAGRVARIMDTSRSLSTRVGSMLLAIVLLAGLSATLVVGLLGVEPNRAVADAPEESESGDANADDKTELATVDELPDADEDDLITVRGRVVDPNSTPLADADVYALRWFWDYGDPKPLASTRSDADGWFTITYRKSQYFETAGRPEQWREASIAAFAPGYGPDWVRYQDLAPNEAATLRLTSDDVPIEGRIVDLEGKPLGGVEVIVDWIETSRREDLTEWLAAVSRGEPMTSTSSLLDKGTLPMFSSGRDATFATDAKGRVRITGIGRERLVRMHVSGSGIATRPISVATRRMEPLAQPSFGADSPPLTNFGARFEYAAAPSRAVEGIVRDAQSGRPLAGAELRSNPFLLEGWGALHVVSKCRSDANGFYRLEGLPKGPENEIHVSAVDAPYFTKRVGVEDAPGFESVRLDIELHRGVAVTGRVIDKVTGGPVSAKVSYVPFRSNASAARVGNEIVWFHNSEDGACRTRPDGKYGIVALPGRGLIRVESVLEAYPGGQGFEAAAEIERREGNARFAGGLTPTPRSPTAFKEIHISTNADDTTYDFQLDPGTSVTVEAVDPQGAPLDDVSVAGWRDTLGNFKQMNSNRFNLVAFADDEVRSVLLYHQQRSLGKALLVRASDGAAGVKKVNLTRCVTITGRLVNADAEPVQGAEVIIRVAREGELERIVDRLETDSDGRFQCPRVLQGLPVGVEVTTEPGRFATLAHSIDAKPGETIDLGTIDVTSEMRPEMVRTQASVSQFSKTTDAATPTNAPAVVVDVPSKTKNEEADATPDKSTQHVTGRVLDPDGKPVVGATVVADWVFVGGDWPRPRTAPSQQCEHEIVARAASDGKGDFELKFSKESPREGRLSHSWHITAFAPGYGPAWMRDVSLLKNKEPVLRLARDNVVRGRIVDLEGKPVAGVRVSVRELRPAKSEQAILDWIAEAKKKSPPSSIGDYFSASFTPNDGKYPPPFPSRWDDGGLAQGSPALPDDTTTDQDGRFEFKNLGENRLAVLEIEGSSVAKSYVHVVSRDMHALSARPLNFVGVRSDRHYGREFELVAEPMQPIEGTVTDADSGEPLANVRIRLGQFADNIYSQTDFLSTRTDDEGRYRLVGAPQGGGHRIDAEPPVDQPYFETEKGLESSRDSFEPIRCDFKLKRGKWIVGTVTDDKSGAPVLDVTVEYLPLRSNEYAKDYPNYDPIISGSVPLDRFRTDKDGRFRVLAIPGAGILAAIAQDDDRQVYTRLNSEQLPKHVVGEHGNLNAYRPWTVSGYNALREVEIPQSGDDFPYNLKLNRGLTRQLKFVDAEGQPVTGVRLLGRVFPATYLEEPLKESVVELNGLGANDERVFAALHPERRIGKAMLIPAGDELTVQLDACAVARGRVVDEDGEPMSEVTVGVSIDHTDNWGRNLIGATSDAEGRFEVLLPPGLTYRIAHYSNGGPNFSAQCLAVAGAVFELGDLAPGTKLSTEQTAKLVVSTNSESTPDIKENAAVTVATTANENDVKDRREQVSAPIEYAGEVVTPDGKPAAGAKVFLIYYIPDSGGLALDKWQPLAVTDAAGRFRFSIRPDDMPGSEREWSFATLAAVADGYGFGWSSAALFETSGKFLAEYRQRVAAAPPAFRAPMERMIAEAGKPLRLAADDVPVRGRVMDIEGQPVAGARLSLLEVWAGETNDLSPWIEATKAKQADYYSARVKTPRMVNGPMVPLLAAPVVTDADGRFTLRGIGRERIAELLVSGAKIQSEKIFVRTRAGETIELPNEWRSRGLGNYTYYPAEFTYVAGPSKPIVGTVRDRKTGQPLAGVEIRSQRRHGHQINGWGQDFVRTLTDEKGRYRLDGMPVGDDNRITAVAPADQPYLAVSKAANTDAADAELEVDFELSRGVWIEGRVTDKASGKGLTGEVKYFFFRNNPNVQGLKNIADADLRDRYRPDDEGRFRIPALPGRGIIGLLVHDNNRLYPRGVGADRINGPKKDIGENVFDTEPYYCVATNLHALAEVNPEENAERIEVNFVLDSGGKVAGRVVDPEGQPLVDYRFSGRLAEFGTWDASDGDKFDIVGYKPTRPRRVLFYHEERRLAGSLIVRGEPPAELVVKLEPAGKVSGRLVDEDGGPLADIMLIDWRPPMASRAEMEPEDGIQPPAPSLPPNRVNSGWGQHVTDKDGRFVIDGLVPGVEYRLQAIDRDSISPGAGRMPRIGGPVEKPFSVEPGQSLDLGDVRLANEAKVAAGTEKQKAAVKPAAVDNDASNLEANEVQPSPKSSTVKTRTVDTNSSSDRSEAIHGQVTGPDGKPMAGAKVAAIGSSSRVARGGDLKYGDEILAETATDEKGNYELVITGNSSNTHYRVALIASAPGAGLAWQQFDPNAETVEASFELKAEQVIRGRLVDIEGRPTARVRLMVKSVMATITDGSNVPAEGVGYRNPEQVPAAWPAAVVTDDDGLFAIRNIAPAHGMFVEVAANDRFAPQSLAINTGMPEQRGERDGTYRPQVVTNLKPNEEAVIPLAPAQIFEGDVTYADTGKPAPHARLTIWASQQKFGSMVSIAGKGDANGHFRLSPYPGIRFGITAYPPDGTAYLARQMDAIEWEDAQTRKETNVTFPRGVLIRGKIVESKNGIPVGGATIQYVPEEDHNPNAKDDILTGWQGIQLSNATGDFEIAVLPGLGHLLVHGPQGRFVLKETSDRELRRGKPGGRRNYAHAVERVDPKADVEVVEMTVELEPGANVSGTLVDDEGHPVTEALHISRLNVHPTTLHWRGDASAQIRNGRFEITGMAADEPYQVHFLDAKNRTGATVALTANDEQPIVKMEPCAQAVARFVNSSGQPVSGYRPSVHMIITPGADPYDFKAAERNELASDSDFVANIDRSNGWNNIVSDADGGVTLPALIPGATYRIQRSLKGNLTSAKDFTVQGSSAIDLGEIVVEDPK